MKRFLPAIVAVLIVAAIGFGFWLSDRSAPIPSTLPATAPAIGSCWDVASGDVSGPLPWPGHAVSCDQSHSAEIFFRSQVDHALIKQYRSANGKNQQAATVLMAAEARSGCTGHASTYLGGTWRSAQLTIVPDFVAPESDGFYACVAAQVLSPGGTGLVSREATLRGALSGPERTALGIDCFTGTGSAATFIPCKERHTGEFVGLYTVTPLGAPFNGPELAGVVTTGCQTLLNQFLALPSGTANRSDLQSSYVGPGTSAEWLGSDQTYACYTYAAKPMTGSVKGLGTRPLPH
jgi:Septum formation